MSEQVNRYGLLKDVYVGYSTSSKPVNNPIQWRDRIREIGAEVERLEGERVALVQKLESEGFRLIGSINEKLDYLEKTMPHHEADMSDWRNWKEGDLLKIVGRLRGHGFNIGDIVRIVGVPSGLDSVPIRCEHLNGSDYCYWYIARTDAEWHSRPD